MHMGLRPRRIRARAKSPSPFHGRMNGLETFLLALSVLAVVDCVVIGWLVFRGFAD